MIKIKITIDTKEDSHAEIRKIIRMLSSLVGEKEVFENKRNVFESDEKTPNLFGMFDNNESKKSEGVEEGMEKKEDKDIPQIIEY